MKKRKERNYYYIEEQLRDNQKRDVEISLLETIKRTAM